MNNVIFTRVASNKYDVLCKKPDGSAKKIFINTPVIYIPFGIEEYKNKFILNIEFYHIESNNSMYNFYSYIKSLENKVATTNIPEIQNKTFVSCIKERNNSNPLLRLHIRHVKNNISTDIKNEDGSYLLSGDVSLKKAECCISVSHVWITDTSFGLLFYVTKIVCV